MSRLERALKLQATGSKWLGEISLRSAMLDLAILRTKIHIHWPQAILLWRDDGSGQSQACCCVNIRQGFLMRMRALPTKPQEQRTNSFLIWDFRKYLGHASGIWHPQCIIWLDVHEEECYPRIQGKVKCREIMKSRRLSLKFRRALPSPEVPQVTSRYPHSGRTF